MQRGSKAAVARFAAFFWPTRLARFVRRNPGIAAWILGFILLGAAIGAIRVDRWLEASAVARGYAIIPQEELPERARAAVDRVLEVIGHGVEVKSVKFRARPYAGAFYVGRERAVYFNPEVRWTENRLLQVAAHECVHALFDQAGLSRYYMSVHHRLVEETAAEVLGAHIAGRLRTLDGIDGWEFTRKVVTSYRAECDSRSPFSRRSNLMRRLRAGNGATVDPIEVSSILDHFGNERLVDAVDAVCGVHPEPWDAAHAIAERFDLTGSVDIPQPLPRVPGG